MFRSLSGHLRTVAVALLRTLTDIGNAAPQARPLPASVQPQFEFMIPGEDDDLSLAQIAEEAQRWPPELQADLLRYTVHLQRRYAREQSQGGGIVNETTREVED